MIVEAAGHAEQIALSAAHAAWAGAAASTFASVVALGVAVWGARREERRRRRTLKDQETAFAFGMVGAFERIKPLIIAAQLEPDGATDRREFVRTLEHAQMIADAAVGVQVFDMQMLRDGYIFQGLLRALRGLPEDQTGDALPHRALRQVVDPVLGGMLDADDRFFARLTAIGDVRGISGRTPLQRPVD